MAERKDNYGRGDVISRIGMGCFTDIIGQMWDTQVSRERLRRVKIGDEIMRFIAAADDRIDTVRLTVAQRQDRLATGQQHLLHGACRCDTCHPLDDWAVSIHDRYIQPHPHLGEVFRVMTHAAGVQLVSDDLAEQNQAAYDIGSTSMQAFVCAGEIVAGRDAPVEVRHANDALGAAAYYMDLAYELPRDVREGARTYGTVLAEHTDASSAARELKARASDAVDNAWALLERRQRRLIVPMMKVLRIQYQLKGSALRLTSDVARHH